LKVSRRYSRLQPAVLACHEGLAMMLESEDVPADAAQFHTAGFARSDALTFERAGKGPEASGGDVGFSWRSRAIRAHPRSVLRSAAAQSAAVLEFRDPAAYHGASGVAGAVLVAENPTDHHIFSPPQRRAASCMRARACSPSRRRAATSGSWNRAAFQTRFGLSRRIHRRRAVAAVRFTVRERTRFRCTRRRVAFRFPSHMGQT